MGAGLGVTAAIMDMLLQTRGGVNTLFPGAPAHWPEVAFERMLTQGAFLVSAARENGHVTYITVDSQIGGLIRFANPWNTEDVFTCDPPGGGTRSDTRLEIDTEVGQTIVLRLNM